MALDYICDCDDAELDAIVSHARAKLRVVAARYDTDEDGLAEMMILMEDDQHRAMIHEINTVRVDPRSGSGLN